MIANQAHAICVHATMPPSGGGPGSWIERVVIRLAILSSALGALDLISDCGSGLSCAWDTDSSPRDIDSSDLFPDDSMSANSPADLLESIRVDLCGMLTLREDRIC